MYICGTELGYNEILIVLMKILDGVSNQNMFTLDGRFFDMTT